MESNLLIFGLSFLTGLEILGLDKHFFSNSEFLLSFAKYMRHESILLFSINFFISGLKGLKKDLELIKAYI